jgi:hypothetical protein
MRIVRAVFLAVVLATAAACGPPPPPVLAHAESTAGLRVRITEKPEYIGTGEDEEKDQERRVAFTGAQRALMARLKEAGYVVVEKAPYDLSAGTSFSIKKLRREDPAFARARLRLKDRKGTVVDEITLEFHGRVAPASEPDRVAVSLVNEMNKSPKIVTFAQNRAKTPATAEADAKEAAPAPAPAPAP